MATIQNIDIYGSIGNSLSTINNNFIVLDHELQLVEIELSNHIAKLTKFINIPFEYNVDKISQNIPNIILDTADMMLVDSVNTQDPPISLVENLLAKQNFVKSNIKSLVDIANVINLNKGKWEQAYTLVSANSARWLSPLTLLYPCIIEEPTYRATVAIRDEIGQWLNKHFPVIDVNGNINYIENQNAYVAFTYKLYNTHPNHTDETVHSNIQTLVFAVQQCVWRVVDYLIGDQIAPLPTSAPTATPTYSPTSTPANTTTPTNTPSNTITCTPTPTLTPVNYFYLKLNGMGADTGGNSGYLSITLTSPISERANSIYYIVYLTSSYGERVEQVYNNIPWTVGNIRAGTYTMTVVCYNDIRTFSTKIVGTLRIPSVAGTTSLSVGGVAIFLGAIVQSK